MQRRTTKTRVEPNKLVTFHVNPTSGEFGWKWRVDIDGGTIDWVDTLSDMAGWLYDRDFPRALFKSDSVAGEYRKVSNLELALAGELEAAEKIREWYRRVK